MIKKLFLVLTVFSALNCFAQQRGTASPYSFFGIGSFTFEGTAENRAMGGLSIYTDSIHFNFRNPASYTGENLSIPRYQNESRPIKFTVGGSSASTNVSSNSGDFNTSTITFDYLGLSFPVGKFGIGLGLVPFTSVGYDLESNVNDEVIPSRFTGDGGINRAFLGVGYRIVKDLNIGLDLKYSFGNITNNAIRFLFDDQDEPLQTQSREINTSDLEGFSYTIGLTYKSKINEKLKLSSAVTFSPQSNLTSRNDRNLASIVFDPNTEAEIAGVDIDIDLEALGLRETDFTLPSVLTLGLGIGEPRKWFVGGDITLTQTSNFTNRLFQIDNVSFENSSKIVLGGFYIPDYDSLTGYFKTVVYRAGLSYENTGLIVNNQSINEFGISFGLGFPGIGFNAGRFFSNANIAVELGQRGTTSQNLVREQFINLQLSLSLNDRWFERRKFN